jgi:hypothetical protein
VLEAGRLTTACVCLSLGGEQPSGQQLQLLASWSLGDPPPPGQPTLEPAGYTAFTVHDEHVYALHEGPAAAATVVVFHALTGTRVAAATVPLPVAAVGGSCGRRTVLAVDPPARRIVFTAANGTVVLFDLAAVRGGVGLALVLLLR